MAVIALLTSCGPEPATCEEAQVRLLEIRDAGCGDPNEEYVNCDAFDLEECPEYWQSIIDTARCEDDEIVIDTVGC